ncbi:MAG: formyltetrahydrofolate deformylase [Pseudomonadota bacterium]
MDDDAPSHVLRFTCRDRVGLIADLARLMAEHGWFIAASRTFGDETEGRFFARLVVRGAEAGGDKTGLEAALDAMVEGEQDGASWSLHAEGARLKTLLLVSKSDHCANMLISAARRGEIPIEPVAIVSNHPDLGPALAHFGLPYHHVPVTPDTKSTAEERLFDLKGQTGADLVVLARYMQVLSDNACKRLAGQCINIHHSFLPSFKGARPYHQAHARGVKVIGATAHYVTADLDEGPIITQVTEPVSHVHGPADMIRIGRHLEAAALMQAVRAHAEQRVFLSGRRTVILN